MSVAAGKSKMASEIGSVTLNRALSVFKYQCPHLYNRELGKLILVATFVLPDLGSDSAPHTDNKGVGAAEAHSRQTDGLQNPMGSAPCVELAHWLHSAKGQRGWRRTITGAAKIQMGLKDNSHLPPHTYVPTLYPPTYPSSHTCTTPSFIPPILLTPESSVRQGLRT